MSHTGRDQRVTFAQTFVAGGIAGVASRTVTSPLDVVKILSQVGARETQNGFLRTFSQLYRNEGLRAFWKGNGMAALRLFPYNAVQFAAFHELKARGIILSASADCSCTVCAACAWGSAQCMVRVGS